MLCSQERTWEVAVAQFDLMSLASIALLTLSIYESFRNWDRKGMVLSMVLLATSLLQTAFLLQFIDPWGALDAGTWTTILAGMVFCLALGLLDMDLSSYARSATLLIMLVSAAQFLVGSSIITI